MTTDTAAKPSGIPQRTEIEEKCKWNLGDIYENDKAWEEEFKRAREIAEIAPTYAGRLNESPQLLYECLSKRSDLSKLIGRLYQYAYLNKDLDNRVSHFQAMTDRATALSAEAGAAFSFVEPELLKLDENELKAMSAQFPKTDEYDLYIKELIRSRAHIRSGEVEEVLAMSQRIARGPDNIFTMLDDADLKYPTMKDENGQEVQLTKQRFARFQESADRRVREDSHNGMYSAYRDHVNSIGASLSSSVNGDLFYATTRRYKNCLESALDGDNIPLDVYHSLIKTTEDNLPVLHEYVAMRKRIMKLDSIKQWDMVCPLFPDQDFEVPYEQAVDEVIEACRPLGEEYLKQLRHAFANRWVDVYETEGKGSGAYNYATFTVHPFVLMNYNGTVDNMFTLAHEMGHALHSHLANSTQVYPKARYSIFVAEVASTLNEGLLLQRMLKERDDPRQRLYLLNRSLDNTLGTFFHQVMYAHFELAIHEEVEKGGALSPDYMCQLWGDLTSGYYGEQFELDDATPFKWARIPHFYNSFYVYQYATSYAASQAILEKFLSGDTGIIERYLKMLSSGGNDYPIELLKICDVDITKPGPVEATIKLFNEQVAEIDRLTR